MENLKWLTEMELTNEGINNSAISRVRNRRAVFVGFTSDGFIKILLENTTTPYVYAKEFWQKKLTPPLSYK